MKKILNKIKENILFADIMTTVLFLLLNVILYIIDMRFRLWFILVILILLAFFFIIGLIQIALKSSKLIKIMVASFLCLIVITIIISSKLVIFIAIFSYKPEHTVELDDKKYVAVIKSFLHIDVSFYDYYGPILMGTKVRIYGDFGKGGFDPFDNPDKVKEVEYTYYNNEGLAIRRKSVQFLKDQTGNIVESQENYKDIPETDKFNENDLYLLPEDGKLLYEKTFGETIIRILQYDYALGRKMLIKVIASTDGGENFYNVSKEQIQIGIDGSKYTFLTPKIGFICSKGIVSFDDGGIGSFKVTTDGGKTFTEAKIKYAPNDQVSVDTMPYYEKGELLMKCVTKVWNPKTEMLEDKELIFTSSDDGSNWFLKS